MNRHDTEPYCYCIIQKCFGHTENEKIQNVSNHYFTLNLIHEILQNVQIMIITISIIPLICCFNFQSQKKIYRVIEVNFILYRKNWTKTVVNFILHRKN